MPSVQIKLVNKNLAMFYSLLNKMLHGKLINQEMLSRYSEYIFISPHLDDAVLSCGQLILYLKSKKKKITLITVFTKGSMLGNSPQARLFLKLCNFKNAFTLFKRFNDENKKAAKFLKIKSFYLKFVDAAWRVDENKKNIYKNAKSQFSGVISAKDDNLVKKVATKLLHILNKHGERTLILSPLAVGGHADHAIIRDIIKNLNIPKIFWEDFPYNTDKSRLRKFFSRNKNFKPLLKLNKLNHAEKNEVISLYKSQMPSLFQSGKIPHVSESYYYQDNSKPF